MKRILTSLLALTIFSGMVACAKTPDEPKAAVENAIKAAQEIDDQIMSDVTSAIKSSDYALTDWDKDDEARAKEILELLESHLSYTVGDSTVNSDKGTAIVTVTITNVDMGDVMTRFLRDAGHYALENATAAPEARPSREEMELEYFNLFKSVLTADDLKTITVDVNVPLVLRDGEWVIQDDREIVEAIFGSIYNYFDRWEDRFDDII